MLLIGLIAGIIIGWLLEWIIDWWFWRNEDGPSIPFLDADRPNAEMQRSLDAARAEADDLRRQLASLESKASQTVESVVVEEVDSSPLLSEPTVSEPTEINVSKTDDLKRIKGIGRVYEGKLNDAGIFTFADLVDASAEQLTAAIEPKEWQALDFDDWASQASSFAKKGE